LLVEIGYLLLFGIGMMLRYDVDRDLIEGQRQISTRRRTMATTAKLLTAEDLARMPTDQPWELWEGELRKAPGAGGEASGLGGVIFALIFAFVRPRKLGLLTPADGTYILMHDPQTVVVPDVAFVFWDRLPGRTPPPGYVPVRPDLAVEVLSPSDEPGDVAKKRDLYRRAGVPLVWWVDPRRRTVAVFRHGQFVAELGEHDELDGEDVLPGFRLPVAEIFAGA
jgi:Uma2 family endonuclease